MTSYSNLRYIRVYHLFISISNSFYWKQFSLNLCVTLLFIVSVNLNIHFKNNSIQHLHLIDVYNKEKINTIYDICTLHPNYSSQLPNPKYYGLPESHRAIANDSAKVTINSLSFNFSLILTHTSFSATALSLHC